MASDEQVIAYARLAKLLREYAKLKVLDFDLPAAAVFAGLRKAKIRIGSMDLKIAAIALANGTILVTRNKTDFEKVPDLKIEDWTRPR